MARGPGDPRLAHRAPVEVLALAQHHSGRGTLAGGALNLLSGTQEEPGATLFLSNCVSCHGANGKGLARMSRRSPAIRSRSTGLSS